MKPIIIKVSKDKYGQEYVSLPLNEFEAAIDSAYDAGFADGLRSIEEELAQKG